MENGPLKMYFLFKMGIFQPAMLVYQRVDIKNTCIPIYEGSFCLNPTDLFFFKTPLDSGMPCSEGPPRTDALGKHGMFWGESWYQTWRFSSPVFQLCVCVWWAYVRENPAPKIASYKVQDMFHF